MKSIGKQDVTHYSFERGTPRGSGTVENRVVYRNDAGEHFINWLGDKRRIKVENGVFVNETPWSRLQGLTLADVMDRIQGEKP